MVSVWDTVKVLGNSSILLGLTFKTSSVKPEQLLVCDYSFHITEAGPFWGLYPMLSDCDLGIGPNQGPEWTWVLFPVICSGGFPPIPQVVTSHACIDQYSTEYSSSALCRSLRLPFFVILFFPICWPVNSSSQLPLFNSGSRPGFSWVLLFSTPHYAPWPGNSLKAVAGTITGLTSFVPHLSEITALHGSTSSILK